MTNLFGTPEAEAARQVFYFTADRPTVASYNVGLRDCPAARVASSNCFSRKSRPSAGTIRKKLRAVSTKTHCRSRRAGVAPRRTNVPSAPLTFGQGIWGGLFAWTAGAGGTVRVFVALASQNELSISDAE